MRVLHVFKFRDLPLLCRSLAPRRLSALPSPFLFIGMLTTVPFQVLLCLFMIVGTVVVVKRRGFALFCNEHDETDVELAFMLWVFYVSKILDFVDTCTCALRVRGVLILLNIPRSGVFACAQKTARESPRRGGLTQQSKLVE